MIAGHIVEALNSVSRRNLREEIEASHLRSQEYGVSREERTNQVCLTPAELAFRQAGNKDFLAVAVAHIEESYDLLSPDDFMMAVVDRDGYILHLAASDKIKTLFAERNCVPGFRWTERDVGTTATSLCLELRAPIQLNDKDHYCKRAHGFTSSAAPIFGHAEELLGVLVASGPAGHVHPHTLGMVLSSARSIERQLRIMRRNRELARHVSFLDGVIDSTSVGIMILDAEARIWRVNRKGRQILRKDDLPGKPVSVLKGLSVDMHSVRTKPSSWINQECTVKNEHHTVNFLFSVDPVLGPEDMLLGAVLIFEEVDSIRKLAKIAGTKAYFTFESLIGSCEEFKKAISLARKAAQSNSTVLIRGETGTGKELFAQSIHNASQRKAHPFVPINCGAIPGELLESELFGYMDGAFTGAQKGGRAGKFELANHGTILLDEIGDMPHDMQVKLLRVLQTGEVYRIGARQPVLIDVRIIACTHVDLSKAVSEGRFREDLFYRLNVFPITIPALRHRGSEDILALASFFLEQNRVSPPTLSPTAVRTLVEHSWPGNVRELQNTIQRALHLCEGDVLDAKMPGLVGYGKGSAGSKRGLPGRHGAQRHLRDAARHRGQHGGNSAKALYFQGHAVPQDKAVRPRIASQASRRASR
jgi:sigma-54 dependent transcriptional regulator, acetoin dehydrogenase operon transcriptional activator AcoR